MKKLKKIENNQLIASQSIHQKILKGSSETTREAPSFNFTDFYEQGCPEHFKLAEKYSHFLTWFIGFFEADGSLIVRESLNRCEFEISQKDPQVLYYLRTKLGFGIVRPFYRNQNIELKSSKDIKTSTKDTTLSTPIESKKKKSLNATEILNMDRNLIYYKFYTSKKEHILRLVYLFNGNLVLHHRRLAFEKFICQINFMWNLNIQLNLWTADVCFSNSWLSGFTEGDGNFYTNVVRDFRTSRRKDGSFYYGFKLKYSITQKGEKEVLLKIRNLFDSTSLISSFRNQINQTLYNRLELTNCSSREKIIEYFQQFSLKGKKKIDFLRWVSVHGYCIRQQKLTERSAKKLARKILNINEQSTNFSS
jgi:hypothetical protein